MTLFRHRPLARELTLIVLAKLCLIVAIKLVFFSDPVKPGSDGTATALLDHAHALRKATHE